MKRFNLFVLFVLVMSLIITACGTPASTTPAPESTATVVPTETPFFGCDEGEPYLWASENDPAVKVPYAQTVDYSYEWGGLKWNAVLGCPDMWRYTTESDVPVYPEGLKTTMSCGDGTTFTVYGIEVPEYACNYSLQYGDQDTTPPQISIRFEKDGRGLFYDLDYHVVDSNQQDGSIAQYLDYMVWAGYPDTEEWADVRCYSRQEEGKYQLMGMAGAFRLDDPAVKNFDAYCGGEGFVLTMSTTR